MMRRWQQTTPLALALSLGLATASLAQGGINVTVDNTPITFDQPPVMQNGAVLVPMRGVFERLGAEVVYNGATRTIVATRGTTTIQLGLGQPTAMINGQVRQLTTPANSVGGRTMVPLRFVSEALGADVRWTPDNRTVAIVTGAAVTSPPPYGQPTPPPYGQPTPPPVTYGPPHIFSVVTNEPNGIHPGDTLQVTMQGDPGGRAAFDIAGLFNNVPMQEQGPGHYVGSAQIPYNANLSNAQIMGHLATPNGQAQFPVNIASVAPPGFSHVHPEENSAERNPRANIRLHVSEGAQLVPSTVRLVVNGQDVTSQATIALDEVSYTPPVNLPEGPNTVYITANDVQGNRLQKQWTFREEREHVSAIRQITVTPTQGVPVGQSLNVTLIGERGGQASFDIGNYRVGIPMTEIQPGQYVGSYTVQPGDTVNNAPLIGHLQMNGQPPATLRATTPINFGFGGGGFPVGVQFTSPQPNQPVTDNFLIAGRARPNTTILLTVRVDTGGLFNFQGNTLNTQVPVGQNGYFQYNYNGGIPFHGGSYVITASDQDPATGQQSPLVTNVIPRQ